MTELDKFKRRLIRSVARLLRQDKTPGEEAWERLKKETGCDCKLLWQRMKALTLKKIKRLLEAEDRTENIAPVARMSLPDWLLYDLVLVHEDLDVIARDRKCQDIKPLEELFELVKKHGIESLLVLMSHSSSNLSDKLVDAWYQLTLEYNGTAEKTDDNSGRKVSPMLLQKRWYQMKERTRANFYKLWHEYKGCDRLWDAAAHKPSKLQAEIAKEYNHVITDKFMDWNKLVEKGLVILPEVFELRHKRKNQPAKTDEGDDKPDLVVIEPVIETIDLEADSDPDNATTSDAPQTVELVTVKQEPEEDGLSNVQILETMHIPVGNLNENPKKIVSTKVKEVLKQQLVAEIDNFVTEDAETSNSATEVKTLDLESTEIFDDDVEIADDLIKQKAEEYCKTDVGPKAVAEIVDVPDDLIKEKADEYCKTDAGHNAVYEIEDDVEISDDLIKEKAVEYCKTDAGHNAVCEIEDDVGIPDDLIKEKADEYCKTDAGDKAVCEIEDDVEISDDLVKDKADKFLKPHAVSEIVNTTTDDDVEISDDLIKEKADEFLKTRIVQEVVNKSVDDVEIPDDLIKQKADEYLSKKKETATENEVVGEVDDIIKQKADCFVKQVDVKKLVSEVTGTIPTGIDSSLVTDSEPISLEDEGVDGIEIVDDGIEYIEDEEEGEYAVEQPLDYKPDLYCIKNEVKVEFEEMVPKQETQSEDTAEDNKFDLKLLMQPVVYTTKLCDMKMFKATSFESIKEIGMIDAVLVESKPVSERANKVEVEVTEEKVEPEPQIESADNQTEIEVPSDAIDDSSNDDDDDDISEDLKVKPSSYLLRKPRTRTYNPIQLCKNPDFNTRLKRLTAGFFSLSANRQLLKECKPMTIDLHKAFEPKLINGTLYLKKSTESPVKKIVEEEPLQTATVLPSAMPVQSLLKHNPEVDLHEYGPRRKLDTVDLTQRSKIINLRDLSEIRRINQQLLTAQVPPMRVDASSAPALPPAINIDEDDAVKEPLKENNGNTEEQTTISDLEVNPNAPSAVGPDLQVPADVTSAKGPTAVRGRGRGRGSWGGGRGGGSWGGGRGGGSWGGGRGGGSWGGGRGAACGFKRGKVQPPPRFIPVKRFAPVTWNKRIPAPEIKLDEFLITGDTLEKMLGKIGVEDQKPYKKPKTSASSTSETIVKSSEDVQAKSVKSKSVADLGEVDVVNVEKTSRVKSKESAPPKPKARKKYNSKVHCCWAREKIHKITFNLKFDRKFTMRHYCVNTCECCCRAQLAEKMLERAAQTVDDVSMDKCEWREDESSSEAPPQPLVRVIEEGRTPPAHYGRPVRVFEEARVTSAPPVRHDRPVRVIEEARVTAAPPVRHDRPVRVIEEARVTSAPPVRHDRPVRVIEEARVTAAPPVRYAPPVRVSTPPPPPASEPQPVLKINVSFATTQPDKTPMASPVLDSPLLSLLSAPPAVVTPPSVIAPPVIPPLPLNLPAASIPDITTRVLPKYHIGETRRGQRIRKYPEPPIAPLIKTVKKAIVIDATPGDIKTMSQKKEAPLFLGKNKILLTTVKFPPDFKKNLSPEDEKPQPQVISPVVVPSGVQLVLLASGELAYCVERGVTLSPEQQALMPSIIAAVQQQINASTVANQDTPTNPNLQIEINSALDLIGAEPNSKASDESTNEMVSEISRNEQVTVAVDKKIDQTSEESVVTGKVDSEIVIESTEDLISQEVVTVLDDVNDKVPEVSTVAESGIKDVNTGISENVNLQEVSTAVHETLDKVPAGSAIAESENKEPNSESVVSRNLLSDLMEMSGISSEDTKHTENTALESVSNINLDSVQTHSVVRQLASALDSTTAPLSHIVNNVESPDVTVVDETATPQTLPTQVQPVDANTTAPLSVPKNEVSNLYQLSPVTSLSELKYACDQNGKFFKLDFETGVIVPINVCIEKNTKAKPTFNIDNLIPKSIIDLTDDVETDEPPASIIIRNSFESPSKNTQVTVKPVKLFKSAYASKSHASILVRKEKLLSQYLERKRSVYPLLRTKRKQDLKKVDVRIDLVDSDEPMEEEYLIDSSDSDSEIRKRYRNVQQSKVTEVLDDSSDDEPLAKKFARLRNNEPVTVSAENITPIENICSETEPQPLNSIISNVNEGATIPEAVEKVIEVRPVQLESAETLETLPSEIETPVADDDPDNDPDDAMEIDQSEVLTFLDDGNDSHEEDCILGV